jgi:hypothetical protein
VTTPSPTQVKFLSQKYLKNLIRTYHNKRVWEFFKDIKNDPVENKSARPRHQERTACYILPKDGTQTIMTKLIFFDFVMGYQRTNQGFYSEPIYDVHAVRKFRPQIELYFLETRENMEPGYKAISGRIKGIRLMTETSESLSNSEILTIANKVKSNFKSAPNNRWHKGKVMCSYNDPERGYKLQLLCYDIAEGKRMIENVLDLQSHTPDWKFLNKNENQEASEAYPTIPTKKTILGKSRQLPRRRPVAWVDFQYAVLHVWGLPSPIVLYDPYWCFGNALLR